MDSDSSLTLSTTIDDIGEMIQNMSPMSSDFDSTDSSDSSNELTSTQKITPNHRGDYFAAKSYPMTNPKFSNANTLPIMFSPAQPPVFAPQHTYHKSNTPNGSKFISSPIPSRATTTMRGKLSTQPTIPIPNHNLHSHPSSLRFTPGKTIPTPNSFAKLLTPHDMNNAQMYGHSDHFTQIPLEQRHENIGQYTYPTDINTQISATDSDSVSSFSSSDSSTTDSDDHIMTTIHPDIQNTILSNLRSTLKIHPSDSDPRNSSNLNHLNHLPSPNYHPKTTKYHRYSGFGTPQTKTSSHHSDTDPDEISAIQIHDAIGRELGITSPRSQFAHPSKFFNEESDNNNHSNDLSPRKHKKNVTMEREREHIHTSDSARSDLSDNSHTSHQEYSRERSQSDLFHSDILSNTGASAKSADSMGFFSPIEGEQTPNDVLDDLTDHSLSDMHTPEPERERERRIYHDHSDLIMVDPDLAMELEENGHFNHSTPSLQSGHSQHYQDISQLEERLKQIFPPVHRQTASELDVLDQNIISSDKEYTTPFVNRNLSKRETRYIRYTPPLSPINSDTNVQIRGNQSNRQLNEPFHAPTFLSHTHREKSLRGSRRGSGSGPGVHLHPKLSAIQSPHSRTETDFLDPELSSVQTPPRSAHSRSTKSRRGTRVSSRSERSSRSGSVHNHQKHQTNQYSLHKKPLIRSISGGYSGSGTSVTYLPDARDSPRGFSAKQSLRPIRSSTASEKPQQTSSRDDRDVEVQQRENRRETHRHFRDAQSNSYDIRSPPLGSIRIDNPHSDLILTHSNNIKTKTKSGNYNSSNNKTKRVSQHISSSDKKQIPGKSKSDSPHTRENNHFPVSVENDRNGDANGNRHRKTSFKSKTKQDPSHMMQSKPPIPKNLHSNSKQHKSRSSSRNDSTRDHHHHISRSNSKSSSHSKQKVSNSGTNGASRSTPHVVSTQTVSVYQDPDVNHKKSPPPQTKQSRHSTKPSKSQKPLNTSNKSQGRYQKLSRSDNRSARNERERKSSSKSKSNSKLKLQSRSSSSPKSKSKQLLNSKPKNSISHSPLGPTIVASPQVLHFGPVECDSSAIMPLQLENVTEDVLFLSIVIFRHSKADGLSLNSPFFRIERAIVNGVEVKPTKILLLPKTTIDITVSFTPLKQACTCRSLLMIHLLPINSRPPDSVERFMIPMIGFGGKSRLFLVDSHNYNKLLSLDYENVHLSVTNPQLFRSVQPFPNLVVHGFTVPITIVNHGQRPGFIFTSGKHHNDAVRSGPNQPIMTLIDSIHPNHPSTGTPPLNGRSCNMNSNVHTGSNPPSINASIGSQQSISSHSCNPQLALVISNDAGNLTFWVSFYVLIDINNRLDSITNLNSLHMSNVVSFSLFFLFGDEHVRKRRYQHNLTTVTKQLTETQFPHTKRNPSLLATKGSDTHFDIFDSHFINEDLLGDPLFMGSGMSSVQRWPDLSYLHDSPPHVIRHLVSSWTELEHSVDPIIFDRSLGDFTSTIDVHLPTHLLSGLR